MFSLTALVLVSSCEKEETSYAFQDVSAPTNVAIAFDIAQDDSGTVTVTPSAEGATMFEIFFGDVEDETAVQVAPGESADHVYAEGSYEMKVVAIGISGLTSELTKVVDISFSKPENLVLDIQTTNLTAKVTPTAENAAAFDIYWGVEDENGAPIMTTVMDGVTALYSYPAEGAYTVKVVARGAGSGTAEATVVLNVSISVPETLSFPLDFENPALTYEWIAFGGAEGLANIVANPDMSQANPSENVLELQKPEGAEVWSGAVLPMEEPINFADGNVITVNVWSPRAGVPILLKIESSADPSNVFAEVFATTTKAGQWEALAFDMSTFDGFDPNNSYDGVVIFGDFGTAGQGETFYFDDFQVGLQSQSLPMTFEETGVNNIWYPFGGVEPAVIANPDQSGENTSATVLQLTKTAGAEVWGGVASEALRGAIDFSTSTVVSVKVWSPKVGANILLKLENAENADIAVELPVLTTVANGWETLTFDMSAGAFDPAAEYSRIVIFPDFGTNGAEEVYYFDDIEVIQ
ncbi:hypothetical protein D3A96_05040 [Robertkochia marina]|nr:hypothetical protein D3A96_05040 [Robertkochia marina]